MPFLPPNKQRQSTEGKSKVTQWRNIRDQYGRRPRSVRSVTQLAIYLQTEHNNQCRRQGEGRGDVQKLCNMCVLSLSWNFFVSHDKYTARPSSKVSEWVIEQFLNGTSAHNSPFQCHRRAKSHVDTQTIHPIDPYLTSSCYKILAVPLAATSDCNFITRQLFKNAYWFTVLSFSVYRVGQKRDHRLTTIILSNFNRFTIFSLKDSLLNLQLNGY